MINKIKSSKKTNCFDRKQWLLSLILFSTLIQNNFCKSIKESDQKINKTSASVHSVPKIIVLQTYKDWSSRLGTNQTTPQTTSLVFEESKEVKTTDYGTKQRIIPLMTTTSTEKSVKDKKDIQTTTSKTVLKKENKTDSNQVNAHNIAAQVLQRIVHITPLLALASNGVPHRINYSRLYDSEKSKPIKELSSIQKLNEIDVDSDVNNFKSERMSASGISFPTTTPITTELNAPLFETPTESPQEYSEHPSHDEEHEHTEHPENTEHEEEEQPPPEDPDEYEDDEEIESFEYPVKISYQDADDNGPLEREGPLPFVMPNIDLNPESLKQKGCRTVVKEVQAIPAHLQKQNLQNPNNGIKRRKRNVDNNSRKFTSIVMTKECHFPGDEGASSEEIPLTLPTTVMSSSIPEVAYQTPKPPSFEEYDEDFDFRPQLSYPYPDSSGLIDRMETKPSNDRRSYADNPVFRRDNSEYMPTKDEFGFEGTIFKDFDEQKKSQKKKSKKTKPEMMSSQSGDYGFDDEDFGRTPPNSKRISRTSKKTRAPLYRHEGRVRGGGGRPRGERGEERGPEGGEGRGKKKPKKVNRSFAFFRKAEPKEKDPNESDYSVSYGRGNFQSFSDSYDSDKDGPRKGGKGRQKPPDFDDDEDED